MEGLLGYLVIVAESLYLGQSSAAVGLSEASYRHRKFRLRRASWGRSRFGQASASRELLLHGPQLGCLVAEDSTVYLGAGPGEPLLRVV